MVMVQAEVAERLAAEPGGKEYGVPSVKARYFGQVRRCGMVSPTVFWPIPRVYSGLVRIDRYADPPWPTDEAFRREVFELVDIAFGAAPQDRPQRLRRVGGLGKRVGAAAARRQHRPGAPRRNAVHRRLRAAAAAIDPSRSPAGRLMPEDPRESRLTNSVHVG